MNKNITTSLWEETITKLQVEHTKAKNYAKFILHCFPGISLYKIAAGYDPDKTKQDYDREVGND